MFRSAILAIALLVSFAVIGCSRAKTLHEHSQTVVQKHSQTVVQNPKFETQPFADAVLLLAENTRSEYLQGDYAPLWDPLSNTVHEALGGVTDYLQNAANQPMPQPQYVHELPKLRKRLAQTLCQIVGVTFKGEKAILLNCFPESEGRDHRWQKDIIWAFDGGSEWWSVIYLPEKHRFTRLRIDLGF